MDKEKQEKGFVIKDKRVFDEAGEVRHEEPDKKESTPATAANTDTVSASLNELDETKEDQIYPEVNFVSFVLSLSTSAMYHFGDFADPVSNKIEKNLPAAKQTIDILTMLQNKTLGNLDENEKGLIDGMLYDLRMRYVKEKS